MDIRQLSYFISVVEHKSFTKAAQHHYIAQTSISQQIMALEEQLNVKLLRRDKRFVELTPAGKAFYQDAKEIVDRATKAIKKAQRVASGYEGSLSISFIGPSERKLLPKLIREFRQTYPEIDLTLIHDTPANCRESLDHRLIDMSFTLLSIIDNVPGVFWKLAHVDPLCAVLFRNHPLAEKNVIRRSVLSNESFIQIMNSGILNNPMVKECKNSGFSPNIIFQAPSLEAVFMMIAAEIGIAIFPRCVAEIYAKENDDIRLVNLEGENEKYVIAWKDDNSNPVIPLFLAESEKYLNLGHTF